MSDSNQTNQTAIPFTKGEMDRISHSLGIDMYKAVMSHTKKDKTLPLEFYRNRYQAASDEYLDKLVENGFAETIMISDLKFYRITEAGITKFRSQFAETVNYKPKKERDLAYLKHRINWYCKWSNYNFGGDNAQHILDEYQNKFTKGIYVSHTTSNTIYQFKNELKSYFAIPSIKGKSHSDIYEICHKIAPSNRTAVWEKLLNNSPESSDYYSILCICEDYKILKRALDGFLKLKPTIEGFEYLFEMCNISEIISELWNYFKKLKTDTSGFRELFMTYFQDEIYKEVWELYISLKPSYDEISKLISFLIKFDESFEINDLATEYLKTLNS